MEFNIIFSILDKAKSLFMSKSLLKGFFIIIIGAFIIFWTVDHSPHAPVGQQITDILDSNEYRMSEFWYYTCLIGGIIIAIIGIRKLFH